MLLPAGVACDLQVSDKEAKDVMSWGRVGPPTPHTYSIGLTFLGLCFLVSQMEKGTQRAVLWVPELLFYYFVMLPFLVFVVAFVVYVLLESNLLLFIPFMVMIWTQKM